MNSLARNSFLMSRRVVTSFTSANHSRPSSSSSSQNSTACKSRLRAFSYYTEITNQLKAFPVAVPLSKYYKKETKAKIQRKVVARLRAKMVESEVPIVWGCIDVIQKRIQEMCNFEIIDASLAESGRAAAVAIVLSKNKLEPEVRIFLGDSVTSDQAEQIPIMHCLQNKRTLIVTDQKNLVSKWECDSKRKGIDKAILTEMDLNSGNWLMYIPSKKLGLYRMCDILSRFVAGLNPLHIGDEEGSKVTIRNICYVVRNMKADDICSLFSKKT